MTPHERLIQQLEDAANRIGDMPRHELQILLRRTALWLRNIGHPQPPDNNHPPRIVKPKWEDDDPSAA